MKTQFPDLEDVSKTNSNTDDSFTERRTIPRISLSAQQFRLKENGKIFSLSDVSREGFALRILEKDDLIVFPVGRHLDGWINLRGEKYPVSARVTHVRTDCAALEYRDMNPSDLKKLLKQLDPQVSGQELKLLPSSGMVARWYHGSAGVDWVFWKSKNSQNSPKQAATPYSGFCIFLYGTYVQWDAENGISTGTFQGSHEVETLAGVVQNELLYLKPDAKLDTKKLQTAQIFISHSDVETTLKDMALKKLKLSRTV